MNFDILLVIVKIYRKYTKINLEIVSTALSFNRAIQIYH